VYKLLLCWRYLLSRYLALACIVSIMLGVATLIVVNSVMGGFSSKLKERLHGLLSDVLVEATSLDGFPDPEGKMRLVRAKLGDKIAAMAATMEAPAMLQFRNSRGELMTRPCHVIGVNPVDRAHIGGFAEFLVEQRNSKNPSFDVDPKRVRDQQRRDAWLDTQVKPVRASPTEPPLDPTPESPKIPQGIIIGWSIGHIRYHDGGPQQPFKEFPLLKVGEDVIITTVGGQKLSPVYDNFVVCDFFKSEMSEYDSNYVFVPIEHLQRLRGMDDRVTSIQLKLKDYRQAPAVTAALQDLFPPGYFLVETWEQKQGPLLAAINIEKGILNVLLFLIICVAGFGILAIFAMIVVEKTRDIGILKAVGASNAGVMNIFLGYGLLLGVVGATLGTALGLTITTYINPIEKALGKLTGQDIFPRDVYYFDSIPTDVQTWMVIGVNFGAMLIAVLSSILPALRAALLHPVRALRYE